jgi:hypothetical protein
LGSDHVVAKVGFLNKRQEFLREPDHTCSKVSGGAEYAIWINSGHAKQWLNNFERCAV